MIPAWIVAMGLSVFITLAAWVKMAPALKRYFVPFLAGWLLAVAATFLARFA